MPRAKGGSIPPPQVFVNPGDGGLISELNENDVLSGRGGRINNHPGNITFRTVVEDYKREYLDPRIRKLEKAHVAARLVAQIRSANPPGRFLREDADHKGKFVEIGDQKAWKKAGQALREDAPDVRKVLDEEIKDVGVMNHNPYSSPQQQQQQQQQQAMMQNTQQMQVQQEDPNAAAQAIQSIGNEAIGAEGSFKVPTLEQHEFQQHIQEIEGAVPFLGKQQQQEQMQQQQQQQMQQQEEQLQMQQHDEQKQNEEEMAKQQLEQVHQRQQAEAEQQRTQAEADQQQQQQQEQQPKESSLPPPEEIDAAHEENVEEERRKPAEEEALEKVLQTYGAQEELQQESMRNEEMNKQQRDESDAAAARNGEANNMNEVNTNAMDQGNSGADNGVPVPEPAAAVGQNDAEGENATLELESLQSELSELMDMVKMQQTGDKG
mmetsp:Transcript_18527/g.28578  ORF Transcript_18527/g.28578 Transcript_18527/m.28578 type:complete len:435 (+) Transcript_18527:188-1492(+)